MKLYFNLKQNVLTLLLYNFISIINHFDLFPSKNKKLINIDWFPGSI